jgi:polysaccharide export outer membrane protein
MKNCSVIVRVLTACVSVFIFAAQLGCLSPSAGTGTAEGEKAAPFRPTDTMYHPGDHIVIEFADNPGLQSPWPQTVQEDGSISLPLNQTVTAAGKRKGELEQAIHDIYVPKLLRRLTVNVRSDERTYFVTGEVRTPGQKPHPGSITALRAIGAAGDFTDFANRSKVEIIRSNGTIETMNARKAQKNPALDLPVYPGDTVHVTRRFF